MYDNYGCLSSIIAIILVFALAIFIVVGFNSCTEATWNDGMCVKCETRYELRGVSKGLKYYACPECGQEVERY